MDEDQPPHAPSPRPHTELRFRVEPATRHLSVGRHVVATIARECQLGNCEIVLLVVSELLANAVQHAAHSVELRVEFHDGYTRIDVLDDGDGWPRLHHVEPLSESGGRGLEIVDRLSSTWGVEDLIPGKQVWSIVPNPAEAQGEGAAPVWPVAV
jgi:anti-sigma regulatory factor (Ser/Thr protein kinase)